MKPALRYFIPLGLLLLLGYHSVYFESLSSRKNLQEQVIDFDAMAAALYSQGIVEANTGIDLNILEQALVSEPDSAFSRYGNRLGIGNSAYFMIQIAGKITAIQSNFIEVNAKGKGITLDTRYIFGNGLRDASRAVALTDFKTTADFNRLSEALNRLVRTKIIPEALKSLGVGDSISVVGAIKLNRTDPQINELHILPAVINREP